MDLSPGTGRELCSLYVIEQHKAFSFYWSLYSYELALLQECPDDSVKSDMPKVLLNASVIMSKSKDVDGYVYNNGGEQLLDVFNEEMSHQFLAKVYDCVVTSNAAKVPQCAETILTVASLFSVTGMLWVVYRSFTVQN